MSKTKPTNDAQRIRGVVCANWTKTFSKLSSQLDTIANGRPVPRDLVQNLKDTTAQLLHLYPLDLPLPQSEAETQTLADLLPIENESE